MMMVILLLLLGGLANTDNRLLLLILTVHIMIITAKLEITTTTATILFTRRSKDGKINGRKRRKRITVIIILETVVIISYFLPCRHCAMNLSNVNNHDSNNYNNKHDIMTNTDSPRLPPVSFINRNDSIKCLVSVTSLVREGIKCRRAILWPPQLRTLAG